MCSCVCGVCALVCSICVYGKYGVCVVYMHRYMIHVGGCMVCVHMCICVCVHMAQVIWMSHTR